MTLVRSILSVFLLLSIFTGYAFADSATKWDKKGREAEARADYDAAFEAYRQAHLLKPKDLRYQASYERMRDQDANAHLDRGRVLRQSGDLGGAITEFSRALQIDRGNQAAAQELLASQMPSAAKEGTRGVIGQVSNSTLSSQERHLQRIKQDIDSLNPPIELKLVSDQPLTLHVVEDTKTIYQAIGKAAGLNVIFDAEYNSKRIQVDLVDVSLADALRIVGKISGTFWSAVTPNTIFVAQNNRAKHTDIDDLAIETFYLTNVSQQSDANEVLVALRNLFDPSTKMFLIANQNAIVIRGTPAELVLAEKLINDIDRTRPEVVVDVAVLEVSRDLERNLGITLPTSFGLTPQASNANTTTSSSSTTSTTSSGSTTTSGITLNTLANINATNFAVTLGGGTVNALLSDSDTRVLQNPRVRATDGQQATLKIGSKIPVATGTTTSTLTSTAASTTQFTYVDVGVNIDMTPTVHSDGEVTLKMKIEISSETGTSTIDGVSEPIISQRVVQQVIQLKDGEPSVLAGLLQRSDTKSISGTPGLGELPFLKYFFSSQDKTQDSDEIVFLLIPHIVRQSLVTDENTMVVDSGTGQGIELRRSAYKEPAATDDESETVGVGHTVSRIKGTSAAGAASAMLGQLAKQDSPAGPDGMSELLNADSPQSPITLSIMSSVSSQAVGSTFRVDVTVANGRDLSSAPMQLQFDPKLLRLIGVDSGDLLSRDGQAAAFTHREQDGGLVLLSDSRPPKIAGVTGSGTLYTLTFMAIAPGEAAISLANVDLRSSKHKVLAATTTPTIVHVR